MFIETFLTDTKVINHAKHNWEGVVSNIEFLKSASTFTTFTSTALLTLPHECFLRTTRPLSSTQLSHFRGVWGGIYNNLVPRL